MRAFSSFFIFCIIITFAFIAMNSRAFEIIGVNPNLIISLFAVFSFLRIRMGVLIGFSFFLLCVLYVLYPFWGLEYIALFFSFTVMYFFSRRLTGNAVGDTIILSGIGTAIFVGGVWLLLGLRPAFLDIAYEMVYNALCGVIIFGIVRTWVRKNPLFA